MQRLLQSSQHECAGYSTILSSVVAEAASITLLLSSDPSGQHPRGTEMLPKQLIIEACARGRPRMHSKGGARAQARAGALLPSIVSHTYA